MLSLGGGRGENPLVQAGMAPHACHTKVTCSNLVIYKPKWRPSQSTLSPRNEPSTEQERATATTQVS